MTSRTQQTALTALAAAVIVTLGATMLAVSTGRSAIQAFAIGMGLGSAALGITFWSLDPGSAERAASRRALALLAPILLYAFGAGVALVEGTRRITEPPPPLQHMPLTLVILAGASAALAGVLYLTRSRPVDRLEETGPERSRAVRGHVALGLAMAMTATAASMLMALAPADGGLEMVSIDAFACIVIGMLMAVFASYLVIEARHAFVLRPSPGEATPRLAGQPRIGPAMPRLETQGETKVEPGSDPQPDTEPQAVATETASVAVRPATPSRPNGNAGTDKTEPGQKPHVVAKSRARRGQAKRR